ncbi:hypothetical protein BDV93DRAFT_333305 [Ceratobasidium sp. AG-I]|nr:hypothetical protein BDV93DRAFT_333305 [Ceratobasidium sp. AG-I]
MSSVGPEAQEAPCTFLDGPTTPNNVMSKTYTIFECPLDPRPLIGPTRFNIHVQYSNPPSGTCRIWLSNNTDSFRVSSPAIMNSPSARFTSPARLTPGFHLDAEAGFITRRLVNSSVLHDVILQRQTVYKELSIYPLSAMGIIPLNDTTVATASITLSLSPKQAIFRDQTERFEPYGYCDYIDDYRSKTVFDVIGSVGGLFALLQSLHILLFGRPMLWGLTGAKLVTPFGLLGACSSAGFKRRLRSEYHRQDLVADQHPKDVAETIRIGAFLRDFVIDFGPADIPPVPSPIVVDPGSPRGGMPEGSEQREILLSTLHDGRRSSEGGPLEVERNTSTTEGLN